ncbi:MAG: pantetheine-phosphate adenylyltransferase [Treponema sp.]|jgi:pantetheine-phosphate adenylyltransferase|nr:pantetheine-phosphate adenylyltransferase [Treponema sp.]
MLRAVFPGSFDPPTNGHLNIIGRGAALFDELLVLISCNRKKSGLFSPQERLTMLEKLCETWENVSVHTWEGLVVEFMAGNGAKILLRGVRGPGDFSGEYEMALFNQTLAPDIETIFLTADPRYVMLRSSGIKELASFRGKLSGLVSPAVEAALRRKFSGNA